MSYKLIFRSDDPPVPESMAMLKNKEKINKSLKSLYTIVKSVLKRHVQLCLIASLIARVHGKVSVRHTQTAAYFSPWFPW